MSQYFVQDTLTGGDIHMYRKHFGTIIPPRGGNHCVFEKEERQSVIMNIRAGLHSMSPSPSKFGGDESRAS